MIVYVLPSSRRRSSLNWSPGLRSAQDKGYLIGIALCHVINSIVRKSSPHVGNRA
jgi:hypothetical protein